MPDGYKLYSIIVPSYNRKEEIKELLDSFRCLDFPSDRFELIIVDDGSTDGTDIFIDSLKSKVKFNIKFIHQKNKGPGAARNKGAEIASGDFYIFVDSDCTVHPFWLKKIDEALKTQTAQSFGGPDSFKWDFPPLLKAINYSMTSFITTAGLRGREGKKLAKYYPRSFNMGLSKTLFNKIGGFGSLRHGQDIEFSNRIIKNGANVIFVADAVVYHKRRTNLLKFFRQVFNWGVARVNLYKIDPTMLEFLHVAPALATLAVFLTIMATFIFSDGWYISRWLFVCGLLGLFLSGLPAAFKYKSLKVFFLALLVMPIQIIGYGLGFIFAFINRVILGRPEFVGFKKRYYI
jgi:glycosyltransferase involved in cell wall biosynthesis